MVEKQGGKGEVVGRCCVVKGLAPPPGARPVRGGAHRYENRCLALLKKPPPDLVLPTKMASRGPDPTGVAARHRLSYRWAAGAAENHTQERRSTESNEVVENRGEGWSKSKMEKRKWSEDAVLSRGSPLPRGLAPYGAEPIGTKIGV